MKKLLFLFTFFQLISFSNIKLKAGLGLPIIPGIVSETVYEGKINEYLSYETGLKLEGGYFNTYLIFNDEDHVFTSFYSNARC